MKPPVARFDPVIHAPARLKLAALLSAVSDMDFPALREALDVSDSVLSKHLKQMEAVGYVRVHKASLDGRVRTRLSITREGRRAFQAHVAALQAVVSLADLPAAAE